MVKFTCNKLARDKTIELMKTQGTKPTYKILKHHELLEALRKKLLEEALEVTQAPNRKETIEELGDVFEVIDALKKFHKITNDEIITAKNKALQEKGGFEKGLFIETIEVEESNPRIKHFRASPDRYIEE